MKKQKKRYGKYVFRWLVAALLVIGLIIGGQRGPHIYLTLSGKIDPDVPDPEQYPVRGVDVSYYQGTIDWQVLAQQGVDFAFIKATEGSDHNDTQFVQNWEDAKAVQIYVGAYHFFSFESSGAEQAANFIAAVPKTENTLPPVVDFELYGDGQTLPSTTETRAILTELLDQLEAYYGVKPIIYTTAYAHFKYLLGHYSGYKIWMSNYKYQPYMNWTFWQYSDQGQLDGYDGDQIHIDLNVYHDDYDAFLKEFDLKPFAESGT